MADTRSFRKKPVVVQAIQWDGTLSGIDDILSVFSDICTVAKTAHPPTNKCSFWKIGTLEGSHEVSAGDFIIRGVKGEYYPCKPDIFVMTYEPATATPPADAALADWLDMYAENPDVRPSGDKLKQCAAALRARAVPESAPRTVYVVFDRTAPIRVFDSISAAEDYCECYCLKGKGKFIPCCCALTGWLTYEHRQRPIH